MLSIQYNYWPKLERKHRVWTAKSISSVQRAKNRKIERRRALVKSAQWRKDTPSNPPPSYSQAGDGAATALKSLKASTFDERNCDPHQLIPEPLPHAQHSNQDHYTHPKTPQSFH